MQALRALLAMTPFVLCAGASTGCGGQVGRSANLEQSGKSAGARSVHETAASGGDLGSAWVPHYPGVPAYPGDSDGDNDENSDENMRTPGREGSLADWRSIASEIRRYYTTALADDGAKACGMMAARLARAIPLEYGPRRASNSRAGSCASIMSAYFRRERPEVVAVARTQKLIDVRLEGDHGYAVLHVDLPCLPGSCVLNLRTIHIANVLVAWEGASWKIDSRLASV